MSVRIASQFPLKLDSPIEVIDPAKPEMNALVPNLPGLQRIAGRPPIPDGSKTAISVQRIARSFPRELAGGHR